MVAVNNELIMVPTGAAANAIAYFDGTRWQMNSYLSHSVNDFRLTLTTALSVTTADVTGATTIYLTPHVGNRIGLHDGTRWRIYTTAELSLAIGTVTSGLPYDVFLYDNAGTLTLYKIAWTNGTTRATALFRQDGTWLSTSSSTLRYVGTFYTTSTTTTEDSAAKRFLFNANNRVRRYMSDIDVTDSWTYTTDSWRAANNSSSNRLEYVCGLSEDAVGAEVRGRSVNATNDVYQSVGVGVDSTTVNSAQIFGQYVKAGIWTGHGANYRGVPSGVGFHYLQWLERSGAAGTTTWYGDDGANNTQTGIVAEVMA